MLTRFAEAEDVEICIKLARQEGETYWALNDFNQSIANDSAIFLVAEVEAQLVGYVIGFIVPTKNNEAMLHETRVALAKRGQKIGVRLVEAFVKKPFVGGRTLSML